MSAAARHTQGDRLAIELSDAHDFDEWRSRARSLVRAGVAPDRAAWIAPGDAGDLFAATSAEPAPLPEAETTVRATPRFLSLARNAILHRDTDRLALLYRLLWELQNKPGLMEDRAHPDVRRLELLDKAVRRDSHKMHAFVRFRSLDAGEGGETYVAWFEPDHHILRANAGFFVRRFANMKWSILTPRGSLHWDGETMREGPPAQRADAPEGDPTEDLWRKYYASIFNPARLKVGAMLKEMPRKYWKNLPEAALIPDLVAGAQRRESAMVAAGTRDMGPVPQSLADIARGISACRQCKIGCLDNRAVPGEGPCTAGDRFSGLMIVGEQPGDQEDESGRPFVGPAGRLLDSHLERAGIDRSAAYLTNAVKHFKFVPRMMQGGKRRLHQTPTAGEIDTCRWWVEHERRLIQPRVILALGASAARSILGRTVSIASARGTPMPLDDGSELWITAHPSYLLRLEGSSAAQEQSELLHADLMAVRARLAALAE